MPLYPDHKPWIVYIYLSTINVSLAFIPYLAKGEFPLTNVKGQKLKPVDVSANTFGRIYTPDLKQLVIGIHGDLVPGSS